jgi:hypothetical protein
MLESGDSLRHLQRRRDTAVKLKIFLFVHRPCVQPTIHPPPYSEMRCTPFSSYVDKDASQESGGCDALLDERMRCMQGEYEGVE